MSRHPRGVTLPELVVYLVAFAVAAQLFVPPVRSQADRMAVNAAREELVALLHRARMEARLRGEARVVVTEGADPFLAASDDRPPIAVPLTDRGVALEVEGGRTRVELAYGPLGVARFAPATFLLRRRGAEVEVVVSGYGRVRR